MLLPSNKSRSLARSFTRQRMHEYIIYSRARICPHDPGAIHIIHYSVWSYLFFTFLKCCRVTGNFYLSPWRLDRYRLNLCEHFDVKAAVRSLSFSIFVFPTQINIVMHSVTFADHPSTWRWLKVKLSFLQHFFFVFSTPPHSFSSFFGNF